MLHFLEVVIVVRRGRAVKSQLSDFRFVILLYVYCLWRGVGEGLVTCHGAAVHWGEGSVIPFRMHLNGFLKNIPQN